MTPRTLPDLFPDATAEVAVEWDDAPCPLCGRHDEEPRFEAADPTPEVDQPGLRFLVVRCRLCGLTYTNPRPSADTIDRFYPADYQPHRRPSKASIARRARPWAERLFGRPCRERRGVLPWPGVGRLLDFGCGGGSYLKRMAALGWRVTGMDSSVEMADRVRDELGLTAIAGTLPHRDLRPCSFDVVTLWHSLEHVHDPLATLREVYRLLVPGGKVVIACPNIDSWAFRRFGASWFGLDLPRHLTHFTPATLGHMLHAAGLRLDSVRGIRHTDWLRSSARRSAASRRGSTTDHLLTWKPAAKFAGWVAYLMGGSDCLLAVAERPG